MERKTPRLRRALRQLGEESLDRVQQRAGGRHKVEHEARMAAEPGAHLGVLMGGVVVENNMHDLAGRDLALDGVQEADELLMAVALRCSSHRPSGSATTGLPGG